MCKKEFSTNCGVLESLNPTVFLMRCRRTYDLNIADDKRHFV